MEFVLEIILPNKIKDGLYVKYLDEYSNTGTYSIALNNCVTCFDSFGVEHIPKEVIKYIDKSTILTNIFRIRTNDWTSCGYFSIGFNDFMLKDKNLSDFANLFLPNTYKKNDDIVLNYFMNSF